MLCSTGPRLVHLSAQKKPSPAFPLLQANFFWVVDVHMVTETTPSSTHIVTVVTEIGWFIFWSSSFLAHFFMFFLSAVANLGFVTMLASQFCLADTMEHFTVEQYVHLLIRPFCAYLFNWVTFIIQLFRVKIFTVAVIFIFAHMVMDMLPEFSFGTKQIATVWAYPQLGVGVDSI